MMRTHFMTNQNDKDKDIREYLWDIWSEWQPDLINHPDQPNYLHTYPPDYLLTDLSIYLPIYLPQRTCWRRLCDIWSEWWLDLTNQPTYQLKFLLTYLLSSENTLKQQSLRLVSIKSGRGGQIALLRLLYLSVDINTNQLNTNTNTNTNQLSWAIN